LTTRASTSTEFDKCNSKELEPKIKNSVLVDARVVNINWYLNYGQKERQIIFQAEAHTLQGTGAQDKEEGMITTV
jgi:hypothetical protein